MSENINALTGQSIDDAALKGIAELANLQLFREKLVSDLEMTLETAKENLAQVRDTLLPDAMLAVGMSAFKLKDGTSISVAPFYSASIPKEKTTEAFAWLRTNDFSEIIKREIKCKFGKGDDAVANLAVQALRSMNLHPEDKESVHPQTLKAFVREQIESGKTLPMELLGVYIGNRAKITPATT